MWLLIFWIDSLLLLMWYGVSGKFPSSEFSKSEWKIHKDYFNPHTLK